MKRFKIHNKANGLRFQFDAESLVMQPEYGQPERWVNGFDLTDEQKASALETRVTQGSMGEDVIEYKLPAEHEIVEEDMTAELAAKAEEELAEIQLKQSLKRLKKSDLTDLDKCATAIMQIIRHLKADR